MNVYDPTNDAPKIIPEVTRVPGRLIRHSGQAISEYRKKEMRNNPKTKTKKKDVCYNLLL